MADAVEHKSKDWFRKFGFFCLGCFLILLVFALFLLFYYLIIRVFTGGKLQNFRPVYSDETGYFTEINTAVKRGLFNANSGYSGFYNGDFLVAKFLNYAAHGIFVLLPYYLIGNIFGWTYFSPIIANCIIMTVSFLIFFFITKNIKKTLICMAFTLTFLPLLLYFGTMMVEVTFFAFSVILAALYYNYKKNPSRKNEIIYIVVAAVSCLMRITNLVFFIPIIINKTKSTKSFLINSSVFAGISVSIFIISSLFTASYPDWLTYRLKEYLKAGQIVMAAKNFASHFAQSLISFVHPFRESPILVIMRYFMSAICLVFLFEAFFAFDFKKMKCKKRDEINKTYLSLSLVIMAVILLTCLFYDMFDWRDFRVFAPILLFVCIGALLRYRKAVLSATLSIVISLIFLFQIGLMKDVSDHYNNKSPVLDIVSQIKYNPNCDRWGNTVLTNSLAVNYDPGINAVFFISRWVDSIEVKAKYLLLDCSTETEGYTLVDEEDGYYLYIADLP